MEDPWTPIFLSQPTHAAAAQQADWTNPSIMSENAARYQNSSLEDIENFVIFEGDLPHPLDEEMEEFYTQQELLNILQNSESDVETNEENDSDDSDSDRSETSITERPLGPLAEEWSDSNYCRPSRAIPFTAEHGLAVQPHDKTAASFFNLLFTTDLLEQLVVYINDYATRLLDTNSNRFARISRWKDITTQDLKIFLGLLFHMGNFPTFDITNYWKNDELFNFPIFKKHMSRDRFLIILRCLNFGQGTSSSNERMNKVSNIVEYFNDIMDKTNKPDRILCIDESLVLYKGRLWIRQYLKGKKNKYGIKLYLLTDQFGLVQNMIVYGGKSDRELGGTDHVNKVVKKLLEKRLNVGHSIYMDNYYNSVGLTEYLLRRKTHVTGTLRSNRRGIPLTITEKKLSEGEKITKYSVDGISITKWKDRREILLISSEHTGEWENHLNKQNKLTKKPNSVLRYTKFMGAVDKHDQMLSYYDCSHKTIRWYKKLGIHILQMLLVNSHNLYNRFGENPLPLADYRTIIIRYLLNENQSNISVFSSLNTQVPINHNLSKIPGKSRKRCVVCYKKKRRCDVSTFCQRCPKLPGLCIGKCFEEYHTK